MENIRQLTYRNIKVFSKLHFWSPETVFMKLLEVEILAFPPFLSNSENQML